jgi:hypothetical protein
VIGSEGSCGFSICEIQSLLRVLCSKPLLYTVVSSALCASCFCRILQLRQPPASFMTCMYLFVNSAQHDHNSIHILALLSNLIVNNKCTTIKLYTFTYNPLTLRHVSICFRSSSDHPQRVYIKGKAVPLQAWSTPEGSRKLSFPDYMTTAQDGGKFVSLTHRPPLPPGNAPGSHFC